MQQLRETHGFGVHDRALRFLSIRLRSRPDTATIEPAVSAARSALTTTNEAWKQAVEERVAASAEVAYLDSLLDAAVADLAREVVVLVRSDRADPRYRKLFATPPSSAMRPVANETQDLFVQNLIQRLGEDADLASLRPHADKLTQRRDALKGALARRSSLYLPETKTAADRNQALDAARRLYNQMPAQLTLAIGNDRALIDSFFAPLGREARAPAASQDEAE